MHHYPRRSLVVGLQLFACLALTASAAIPSVEKLLPDDTLFMVTTPDFTKLREVYKSSPQTQFWSDPAMKPFRDNFMSKLQEQLIQPLEHDLGVHFSDYTNLPQGQITFAVTQNGWPAASGQEPSLLLLLDTKDKSTQLMKDLSDIRKKWVEAGKNLRTEKIRDTDFTVLPISEKDIPKTLRKFSGQYPDADADAGADSDTTTKTNASKSEIYLGQYQSLLIVGTSAKPIEKVMVHLTGGQMPCLGDLAAYDANRLSLFRDSPFYAWANAKSFLELLTKKQVQQDPNTPDPFPAFNPGKILDAIGFGGLKTLAFTLQMTDGGATAQFYASIPESSRQGIFAVFPGDSKDATPPSFVPADVVKFQRWRVDGQKVWTTLQNVLGNIWPQAKSGINFMVETANDAAKQKDPDFDLNKNFFANLGDDMISYEKAPRGTSRAELASPPSLFLLSSPNPDQLVSAFKYVLLLANQQGAAPKERDFLGRKIYSIELGAAMPAGMGEQPAKTRTLSYTASGGYMAISTDDSMIEEYLRSSDSQQKKLREVSGLTDAIAKVNGSSAGLFGYENELDTTREIFQSLKNSPTSKSSPSLMPSFGGLPSTGMFKDMMDFSLLPSFDQVAKYFGISVYSASSDNSGITFKIFTPVPPGLRK